MLVRKIIKSFVPLIAGGVAVVMASTVSSNAATVEFRGGGYLTGFTAGCGDIGWKVGGSEFAKVRYRPAKLGDNGATARLAFHFDFYAVSLVLNKGSLVKKYKTVQSGGTGSGTWIHNQDAKMRFTSIAPKKVKATTNEVTIAGDIKGFDGQANCNVSFRAGLTRRP